MKKKRICLLGGKSFCLFSTVVVMFLIGMFSVADAFIIPTGSEDFEARWDNSFRYNYGIRLNNADPNILGDPNIDDGDRNFGKGEVSNRLDIMSEFDFSYKKTYGLRVSGAFWYDQAYYNNLGNDHVASSNHIENGTQVLGLHDETEKSSGGPTLDLLDAFVHARFELGNVPVSVKLGRHTIYYGEALLFGGALNGLSYGQTPIDLNKAFSVPGAEVKELFRPLFNISAIAQFSPELAIFGQYFLQWEGYKFPESGSYLCNGDMFLKSGQSIILGPGFWATHGDDSEPEGTKNWGVGLTWSPKFLAEARIGFYYRRASDMLPQIMLNLDNYSYTFAYADGIDIYGISLSKMVGGISIGMEYSMRNNMPLSSQVAAYSGMPAPKDGETYGARGNTQHATVNFMGFFSKSPVWQSAVWNAEFNWGHYDRVKSGAAYFKDDTVYNAIDAVTRNSLGFACNLNPSWYQVFPGWDFNMPISYSRGLVGVSPLMLGDAEGAGSFGIGIGAEAFSKYIFSLSYVKYYGDFDVASTGAITGRGSTATMRDRDTLSFTFKWQI